MAILALISMMALSVRSAIASCNCLKFETTKYFGVEKFWVILVPEKANVPIMVGGWVAVGDTVVGVAVGELVTVGDAVWISSFALLS